MGANIKKPAARLESSVTSINTVQTPRVAAIWIFKDCDILVHVLLCAKIRGVVPENDFDAETWSKCSKFLAKYQKTLADSLKTPGECKKQWQKMVVKYLEMREIRNHKEFKGVQSGQLNPSNQNLWAAITVERPELLKWRYLNFRWFDDMDFILGDAVYKTSGNRYAIKRRIGPVRIEEGEEGQEEEPATLAATTSTESAPRDIVANHYDDDDDAEAIAEARCQPPKRHADTTTITRPSKKAKTSPDPVMTSNAIDVTAAPPPKIYSEGLTSNLVPQERVDSTISGQAQLKIQKETCLTPLGTVEMLDFLADSARARTYIAIEAESLRRMWIEKQLRGLTLGVACMKELFIETD